MPALQMRDGTKIFYGEKGRGHKETLVFVNGLSCTFQFYMPFIDEFKKEYHCVFYDMRGHGASEIPKGNVNLRQLGQDLQELIEFLDLEDVTLVAHSMGVTTSLSYVDQFGCDRIKRIVAIDMSPCLSNKEDWKGGLAYGAYTDEDWMVDMDNFFISGGKGWWEVQKKLIPELASLPEEIDALQLMQTNNGRDATGIRLDTLTQAGLWFSLYRTDLRDAVGKIDVPLLYVMPDTPFYNTTTTDFFEANVKGGFTLAETVPGTTHFIQVEKPVETAAEIKKFLKAN